MGAVDDELGDEVFFARLHPGAAGAAAALLAVDADRRPLEVALVADGDGDLLVGDEVFEGELGALVEDDGAAGVAVLVANVDVYKRQNPSPLLMTATSIGPPTVSTSLRIFR